jgi:hypothetical protein
MKDQVIFVLMLMTLGWGFYKSWKTKNEGLFCATLFCGSVFSIKYPFYVPIGFAVSFVGFFGFGFLLYKILYQKLDKSLMVPAILLLISGIVFLLQGFSFPERSQLWVSFEFIFGACLFLGFGIFLYKILRYKLDRSLLIFDLSLLAFGMIILLQAFFLPVHTQSLFGDHGKQKSCTFQTCEYFSSQSQRPDRYL